MSNNCFIMFFRMLLSMMPDTKSRYKKTSQDCHILCQRNRGERWPQEIGQCVKVDRHTLTMEEHPMSKTKRKRYSAEFKSKVALEAIKGEQTLSELGSRYGLHPNMIANWKRQAIENMADSFSSKNERNRSSSEAQIKDLHAKIGELTVERDFLTNAFNRCR